MGKRSSKVCAYMYMYMHMYAPSGLAETLRAVLNPRNSRPKYSHAEGHEYYGLDQVVIISVARSSAGRHATSSTVLADFRFPSHWIPSTTTGTLQ